VTLADDTKRYLAESGIPVSREVLDAVNDLKDTTDERSLTALLEARKAIAAVATPGPWTVADSQFIAQGHRGDVPEGGQMICAYWDDSTAQHIAANDPATATLYIDLALAAERRRQAGTALDTVNAETRMIDYPSSAVEVAANAFLSAIEAEDAALTRLHEHLRREGE
jgi:hypothetical protein